MAILACQEQRLDVKRGPVPWNAPVSEWEGSQDIV